LGEVYTATIALTSLTRNRRPKVGESTYAKRGRMPELANLKSGMLARDEHWPFFLSHYPDGAILDEVQRCPELFSYLQTRLDQAKKKGLFVLTGSQQFNLLSGITQSLAGRVALIALLPFALPELQAAKIAPAQLSELLFRGLYPPLYDGPREAGIWYGNYMRTYIERDVRQSAGR
jgi:hypothetical protein